MLELTRALLIAVGASTARAFRLPFGEITSEEDPGDRDLLRELGVPFGCRIL
ncbi:MAG: hypothetical protein WA418_00990 [Bradyrhizobium sp.]